MDSRSEGTAIAAEGGKKFSLTTKSAIAAAQSSNSSSGAHAAAASSASASASATATAQQDSSATDFFLNFSSSDEEQEEEREEEEEQLGSDVEEVAVRHRRGAAVAAEDDDWEYGAAELLAATHDERAVHNSSSSSTAAAPSGRRTGRTVIAIDSDEEKECDEGKEVQEAAVIDVTGDLVKGAEVETDTLITLSTTTSSRQQPAVDWASYVTADEAQDVVPGFYSSLHDDGDEEQEEEQFDDVAWESDAAEEVEEEAQEDAEEVLESESVGGADREEPAVEDVKVEVAEEEDMDEGGFGSFSHAFVKHETVTEESTVDPRAANWAVAPSDGRSKAIDYSANGVYGTASAPEHTAADRSADLDSEALSRAVHTASSMADWAGRAVRSALKEHMRSTSDTVAAQSPPFSPGASSHGLKLPGVITAPALKSPVAATEAMLVDDEAHTVDPAPETSSVQWPREFHPPSFDTDAEQLQWERAEEQSARRSLASAMRDTASLTEEMKEEVMQLIRAFDLPYVVAPFEAEAQCCVLEQVRPLE